MIKVELTQAEIGDRPLMRRLAIALLALAGEEVTDIRGEVKVDTRPYAPARQYADVPDAVKMGVIDPQDVPSVGEPAASEVFGEPSAAAVFGGNVAPGALPSTLPDGTPPAPSNGGQTVGGDTLVNGVDVDKDGLPWNGTIHASTKVKTADGRWKKRRGVDESVIAKVESDLRGVMAIPAPPPGNVPATGASGTGVPTPPPATIPPAPFTAPPAPGTIPTPPAGAAPKITGFAQLLPAVTNGIAAGTLTEAQVQAALQKAGVAVLPMLAPRPDLVAVVAAELFPGQ